MLSSRMVGVCTAIKKDVLLIEKIGQTNNEKAFKVAVNYREKLKL